MSYGVHAYAIDLEALGKVAGSGNAVLAKRLVKRFARELEQIDDADFEPGPTSAEDVLTRLVVDGVPARAAEDEPAYKWGYALELVCRELAEPLPNRVFSGMGGELFDAMDAALKAARSKRGVSAIFFDGPPLALPEIEDFPSIGHLNPAELISWRDELRALLGAAPAKEKRSKNQKKEKEEAPESAAFSGRVVGTSLILVRDGKSTKKKFPTKKAAQAALLEALRAANRGAAAPESEATEAFRELLGWLDAAAAKKLGLVTFYY